MKYIAIQAKKMDLRKKRIRKSVSYWYKCDSHIQTHTQHGHTLSCVL